MLRGQVNETFRDYEGFCREMNIKPTYEGYKTWILRNLKTTNK